MSAPIPFAWVAGVIDARGHIEVVDRHGRGQPRVRITTARTALLLRLADLTGTSVKIDERGYERRPCGEHCNERHSHVVRQSAYWNVDSGRATLGWDVDAVLTVGSPRMSPDRAADQCAEAVADMLPDPIPGHENCEPAWECKGCGRAVCPRCEVSPGKPDLCPECWEQDDPEEAA